MDALLTAAATKKARFDRLRPLAQAALRQLRKHHDVELTYTSNAIEGNTLTLRETAEVIEHGITVGDKPLKDHLEALDHYEAVGWMREIAAAAAPLGESVVCELHRRVVARSEPWHAGQYSHHARRIAGSSTVFPNPLKLPDLMREFGTWLNQAGTAAATAFDAHHKLTAIHPFTDGNGRTARLLMNLLLIRGGYPPIAVRPVDRAAYLDALEHASLTGDLVPFQTLMHSRLDATLHEYLALIEESGIR